MGEGTETVHCMELVANLHHLVLVEIPTKPSGALKLVDDAIGVLGLRCVEIPTKPSGALGRFELGPTSGRWPGIVLSCECRWPSPGGLLVLDNLLLN